MAEGFGIPGDLDLFLTLGKRLDEVAGDSLTFGREMTLRDVVIESLLRIRDKDGKLRNIKLNRAQREYAARATRRNVVLKARQLGISTYIAARYFVETVTHPGTLTVQVAHDQESAEQIFRIVHRFLENLPEPVRKSALRTSRANTRQLVFPELDSEYRVETAADPNAGRGLTIHNLHCSEVARWPRDGAATLASLRAAVPPGGEVALESTPNGAAGVFYNEWQRAEMKAHMRWLVGEGNQGKVQDLEQRVEKHEAYLQRMAGVGAVVGFLMTMVHFAFDYLRMKH